MLILSIHEVFTDSSQIQRRLIIKWNILDVYLTKEECEYRCEEVYPGGCSQPRCVKKKLSKIYGYANVHVRKLMFEAWTIYDLFLHFYSIISVKCWLFQ